MLTAVIIAGYNLCYGQTQLADTSKNTITLHMKKVSGIGPAGSSSIGPHAKDQLPDDDDERKTYTLKNIPANLTNVREYNQSTSYFQSLYQNYTTGITGKAYFIKRATGNGFNLADTVKLSRKPIRCDLSLIIATDGQKNMVYMADLNNNNDLADDVAKPLTAAVYGEELVVNLSDKFNIEYLDGTTVKQGSILAYISKSFNPKSAEVSIAFPEYLYKTITYHGQSYFLCTSGYSPYSAFAVVLPAAPNFSSISSSKRIKVDRFFKLDDDDFRLVNIDEFTGEVTISGDHISELQTDEQAATPPNPSPGTIKNRPAIVSTSLGYQAPLAAGVNINTVLSKGNTISTKNLRGKYVYLDFWGTYCLPCIQEIPNIREAYLKFGRDKFEIIGILDEKDPNAAKDLLKRNNVIWPNISMNVKSSQISGYGKILSFPTSYLIDPEGKIIAINLRGNELVNKLIEVMRQN